MELSVDAKTLGMIINVCEMKMLTKAPKEYARLGVMSRKEFFEKVFFDDIQDRENWKVILKEHEDLILKKMLENESIIKHGKDNYYISPVILENKMNHIKDNMEDSPNERFTRWTTKIILLLCPSFIQKRLSAWLEKSKSTV
jgi:hypothetical protein